ncbi:aconitate hydratase AcnA [Phaeovibrio sulfidiphilus]|uniref:Aconitate hydratase n=1 Tax=Phaeovibrio sulfidiphilus TaxID=1220600 RepID=A0A8J6YMY1_9PROT|nr:aconitate hydratase AcnA [Phaeovibrio sulfidiphilus]MBE1237430.1 aconitate hydratase AcnA [Phaeovibrio sulfidiphilus]
MALSGHDTMKTRRTLKVGSREYDYFSLEAAGLSGIERLPNSLKVLLENLLRYEDGRSVTTDDVKAVAAWLENRRSDREIAYRPARVLMQDFTGVPAVVDLAAMREAVTKLGGDPESINPLSPVDLVIDHSVMIDHFGTQDALGKNIAVEFQRNGERYAFLRWGQKAFDNFRVVPPGVGICHQVNLEYLARVIWSAEENGRTLAFPDTLVGTDSHTTMVNGLGVLGWGVGGIEAEAAMLGQPVSMLIPEVVGFRLTGTLPEGTTATDLVLTVTQMLRKKGVVGKFVEFYGEGLNHLPLTDRATISNMAPEYGATCGFFPVDAETLRYMRFTGRDEETVALVEAYARAQGMWHDENSPEPVFTDTLSLDMGTVQPSLAGPSRPQDRVTLAAVSGAFGESLSKFVPDRTQVTSVPVKGGAYRLEDGAVVIAAITSCTNTSNPSVMMAAGLVAKKAVEKGLTSKPWVKTSLAPGSQVVAAYLEEAGLQTYLDTLGFDIAGFGCTTCIGNSGPLIDEVAAAIDEGGLVAASVISGNRNFEGRIHAQVRASYLASPPLVVAYALAGSMNIDLTTQPLGQDKDGNDVYLKDIWPTAREVSDAIASFVTPQMFRERYGAVFTGSQEWQDITVVEGETYAWDPESTYVRNPPYFDGMGLEPAPVQDIVGARPLAILGDSITTDHISPAGSIKADSPAGRYLTEHGVSRADFNSYGSRRGNHEVMMRGTFANIRIRNKMTPGVEGGVTCHQPSGEVMAIYDAAMAYKKDGVPLVVIGGKEYGSGSSRDWAAKGTNLLGVRAVIVESFERIHRSNLVGMGILPLQFQDGVSAESLGLTGTETFDIRGLESLKPRQMLEVVVHGADGSTRSFEAVCRIDTLDEIDYYRNGGILQTVLRNIAKG